VLKAVGDTLFFTARDETHGRELWKSDGTPEGTVLVKDIYRGTDSAFPTSEYTPFDQTIHTFPFGDVLIFNADDGIHGKELWRSDGTAEGTFMLKDIAPGEISADPNRFRVVGDTLLFSTSYGYWQSDGTAEGTIPLEAFYPIAETATHRFLYGEGPEGPGLYALRLADPVYPAYLPFVRIDS
jgi:ELWxxDGT repeat protein